MERSASVLGGVARVDDGNTITAATRPPTRRIPRWPQMLAAALCCGMLWFWVLIFCLGVNSEASHGIMENLGFWLMCTAFIAIGSIAAVIVMYRVWLTDLAWYARWASGLVLTYLRVLVALELFFVLFCVVDFLSFGRVGVRFEWQVFLVSWPEFLFRHLAEQGFGLLCLNLVFLSMFADIESRLLLRCTRPA